MNVGTDLRRQQNFAGRPLGRGRGRGAQRASLWGRSGLPQCERTCERQDRADKAAPQRLKAWEGILYSRPSPTFALSGKPGTPGLSARRQGWAYEVEENDSDLLPEPGQKAGLGLENDGVRQVAQEPEDRGVKHFNADHERFAARQRTGSPAETLRRTLCEQRARRESEQAMADNIHSALAQRRAKRQTPACRWLSA